ncbi:MAG: 4-hydroxybenzoate 3-monooxygenase [Hyphomicrobiaceae bacterium]
MNRELNRAHICAQIREQRTQVGILGAGPAGLLLSHLLHLKGIESVVLEAKSRAYVEARIRAGVLEHGTVDTLQAAGVGERLKREGLIHSGIHLAFAGRRHHLDFTALTGRSIAVYGQQEVVKDLIAARLAAGGDLRFEAEAVALADLTTERPKIAYRTDGTTAEIVCDIVAGCDGFHGLARTAIPAGVLTTYERDYPFAWLGILAAAPPAEDELTYARHAHGFALFSMRSPELTRLYLQCTPDEDLARWPDERIWQELHLRLEASGDWRIDEGAILQKAVTGMRSFVVEPMQYGRLFLAGDAAHIVPPTGAKGMNLAVADVRVLTRAIAAFYRERRSDLLDAYSSACLGRVWKAQRFSWWMTSLLHTSPDGGAFADRLCTHELDEIVTSPAAAKILAENYVGLSGDP